MTFLGEKTKKATRLPIGINVLWNDYKAALSIAKILNLQFIHVPVFVDKVQTGCGVITGQPKEVISFRKLIKAENVALFTDIHVKHAKLLSKHSLMNSVKLAIKNKSDAIIITGKWTGQAPTVTELKSVRKTIDSFPILVGSGANKENIADLLRYADGVIVSTSLKRGPMHKNETNIKNWKQRIDKNKVREFIAMIQ